MASSPPAAGPLLPHADLAVRGSAIVYRLFDVGYGIRLDRAAERLASRAPSRATPIRPEAEAIRIANPPLTVLLGTRTIPIEGRNCDATLSAAIFDFGTLSLRLSVSAPPGSTWERFTTFGQVVDVGTDLTPIFERELAALLEVIGPAIERPLVATLTEDYVVFRVESLTDEAGRAVSPQVLGDDDVAPLLLAARRPLAESARRDLLPHRFSYYPDDLAVLTWDNALVVEREAEDTDVQYVLEFANAQLLELRLYDAILDAELARMYGRIAGARSRTNVLFRRHTRLLAELQGLVADFTEFVERVENALKVTDDVFLARVYSAALELFRGRAWRAGIDRKLAILRDTYAMLNADSQAARAETLELAIVLLIVAEIALAFVRGH